MQTGVRHRVTCGGLGEWCNGQHDGLWNRMLQVRILPRLRKVGPWCRLAHAPHRERNGWGFAVFGNTSGDGERIPHVRRS